MRRRARSTLRTALARMASCTQPFALRSSVLTVSCDRADYCMGAPLPIWLASRCQRAVHGQCRKRNHGALSISIDRHSATTMARFAESCCVLGDLVALALQSLERRVFVAHGRKPMGNVRRH